MVKKLLSTVKPASLTRSVKPMVTDETGVSRMKKKTTDMEEICGDGRCCGWCDVFLEPETNCESQQISLGEIFQAIPRVAVALVAGLAA